MELRYDISVVGQDKVKKALRSIDAELQAHQRRLSRRVSGESGGGRRVALGPRSETARGFAEVAKAGVAADRARHREVMANIKREERAKLAAIKKAEAEEIRAAKKAAQEATKQDALRRKQDQQALRTAQQTRARFGAGVATSAGNAVRGTAGLIGTAVGVGGVAFGVGAVKQEMATGAKVAAIANAGYEAGGPSREALAKGIRGRVTQVAGESGRSTDDLLGSVEAFGAVSGDLKGALKLLPKIAEIADASGGEGNEIAKSLALAMRGIQQATPGISQEELEQKALASIRVMAGQGKVGSIELADQARAGASRTVAAAGQFSGDVEKNMATLGALAQMAVAQGGAATADEGFMSITRLSSDIVTNQKRLKDLGVDVFTDDTNTALRAPEEILIDAVSKAGGDMSKLSPIFGQLSSRAVNPLRQIYTEAGGGEAGVKAMRDALGELQGAALSEQEVTDSATFRRSQDDRQAAMVWDKFNREVGQSLVPVLQKSLPQFAAAIPELTKGVTAAAKFAAWFADNPIKGLGSIVLATIVKDLAAAKIGSVVSSAIASLIAGPAAGGKAGAVVGAAAQGGAGAAAGGAGKYGLSTLGWAGAAVGSSMLALSMLDDLAAVSGYGKGLGQTWNPLANGKGDMTLGSVGSLLSLGLIGEDEKGNLSFGTSNLEQGWMARVGKALGASGLGVYDMMTAPEMTYGGAHGASTKAGDPRDVLGRAYLPDGSSRPLSDEEIANLDEAAAGATKSIGELANAVTEASSKIAAAGGNRGGDPIVGATR